MKKALLALLVMTFFVAPMVANADMADKVTTMLSDRHSTPTPGEIRSLGADGVDALMQIVDDEGQQLYKRVRALYALGHSGKAGDFLRAKAADESTPVSMRTAAMVSFGRTGGEGAEDFVEPFLKSGDMNLRNAAHRSLKAMGTERAGEMLRNAGPAFRSEGGGLKPAN